MSRHPAIGGLRLVLGGNAFGWTADRDASFAVLDAFHQAGGRMIDTAESYSLWVPGNKGGESEAIIGAWMESRGVRKDMLVATKTGMWGRAGDLAPDKVADALDQSLERLRTDYVDLYYAHRYDPETPLDEVAQGFGRHVAAGRVRELGASNFTATRLEAAIEAARRSGQPRYSVLQNQYNLIVRDEYPPVLQALVRREGVAVLPYYGLASGFLSGRYRKPDDWANATRGERMAPFAERGGFAVLETMDRIAAATGASVPAIALAWLNAQPGIAAPIAGAKSPEQLARLIEGAKLMLAPEHVAMLDAALPT